MPGVGISRCIITLEPAERVSPPPVPSARPDEALALPAAHLSANVAESRHDKEKANG